MLKLYKKYSIFSNFVSFQLNNKNTIFSKIWVKGPLATKFFYLPTEINFLYKNFYFYFFTFLNKVMLTVHFSMLKTLIIG